MCRINKFLVLLIFLFLLLFTSCNEGSGWDRSDDYRGHYFTKYSLIEDSCKLGLPEEIEPSHYVYQRYGSSDNLDKNTIELRDESNFLRQLTTGSFGL